MWHRLQSVPLLMTATTARTDPYGKTGSERSIHFELNAFTAHQFRFTEKSVSSSLPLFPSILFIYSFLALHYCLAGKFGSPYLGKATAAAGAVLPIPNSACGILVCPNKGMAASAWDF